MDYQLVLILLFQNISIDLIFSVILNLCTYIIPVRHSSSFFPHLFFG